MRRIDFTTIVSILISVFAAGSANADVLNAQANGFTIRHQVVIAADKNAVYEAAVDDIGRWWNGDHTVSGDASNLFMDARVQGCFCETLGDGAGLVHLSISFVNPGVILRFNGGLGPLGLLGVAGNMTWEFDATDDGTVVTLYYAVGGYMPGGLDTVSAAVDGVLVEAMARLASYVETGSPTGPAEQNAVEIP